LTQQPGIQAGIKRSTKIVIVVLTVTILLGISLYYIIPRDHDYSIAIVGSACWKSYISDNSGELSLFGGSGCGNQTWQLTRQWVSAGFEIKNGTGTITLTILKDGGYCAGNSTIALANRTISANCHG